MARLDVAPDDRLLLRLLRDPDQLNNLTPQDASRAIDAAESARLLGWIVGRISAAAVFSDAPPWFKDRLAHMQAVVAEYDRAVRWEIDRLDRALTAAGITWVLLKGAGYLAAGLPNGRGRRVADLDVLVAENELSHAEEVLRYHGWDFANLDPYDERYYREWMHELPPMIHRDRGAVVDLHHAVLPRTSRLHPSSVRLIERSVQVGRVRVLCPSHMVLHAGAHLFHDGEIAGAIRDLVDLDTLLRCFDQDRMFWNDLKQEAVALELTRPAYYGLRYSRRMFNTPIPTEVLDAAAGWAPPAAVRVTMDLLVERALQGRGATGADASAFALYVRSHWLRMPLLLLARHLTRKALRSRS